MTMSTTRGANAGRNVSHEASEPFTVKREEISGIDAKDPRFYVAKAINPRL